MFAGIIRLLYHSLFDTAVGRVSRSQSGRWILGGFLLLLTAACVVFTFTDPDQSDTRAWIVGAALFGLVTLVLIGGNIAIGARRRAALRVAADTAGAQVRRMLAEGTLLPIPRLPTNNPGATPEDLTRVEAYVDQLRDIPWGRNVAYTVDEARPAFEAALTEALAIAGDWGKLSGPIAVFARLSQPLCHVGAAEAMFRLSYLRGTSYAFTGLRQGLRFTTYAQTHTTLQPDALITQLRLLSACRAPTWEELATKTLGMIQRVAPDHPRLPQTEMFYHRMRGEFEQALECADRAIETMPEALKPALLSSKGMLMMNLKRYEEAVVIFHTALARTPEDPWIWHNLSLADTQLGRYAAALQDNDRALALMEFGVARTQRDIILKKMND